MSYKPDGWATVTPRLFTQDVQGLVDFLKRVFDAHGDVPLVARLKSRSVIHAS